MELLVSTNLKFAQNQLTFIGYVFEGIDLNTGKKVALKRTQKVGNKVSREFEVLSLAKGCPNIV